MLALLAHHRAGSTPARDGAPGGVWRAGCGGLSARRLVAWGERHAQYAPVQHVARRRGDEPPRAADGRAAPLPSQISCICLALSAHERPLLASTHGDHTVKISDCAELRQTTVLDGHVRTPWVAAWHPRLPDLLVTTDLDSETILWDTGKAQQLQRTAANAFPNAQGRIRALSWSASGHVLAVGLGRDVFLIRLRDWQVLPAVVQTNSHVLVARFHPVLPGLLLATRCEAVEPPQPAYDPFVTRARANVLAAAGAESGRPPRGTLGRLRLLALPPEVVAGAGELDAGDAGTPPLPFPLVHDFGTVYCNAFYTVSCSPCGKFCASAAPAADRRQRRHRSELNIVHVRAPRAGDAAPLAVEMDDVVRASIPGVEIVCTAFSPTSNLVLVGLGGGLTTRGLYLHNEPLAVIIYDRATGSALHNLHMANVINTAVFHPLPAFGVLVAEQEGEVVALGA